MTDDPLKRGTPPGSLRQFAVTYAPAAAQGVLEALYAYEAEIDDTVQTASHEVAHTRLQWWRGEIDRLQGGHPQHPITRALLPLRDWAGEEMALLHEPLAAADIDLARMVLQDARELEAWCFRAAGSLQTLAALACSQPRATTEAERQFARRLGSVVRRTERLRDLRGHLAQGRLPLPLDSLAAAGIEPDTLKPDAWSPALDALIESQRQELLRECEALPTLLAREERTAQRHGLVLAALHQRLLARIEHRTELARSRAEVPPWTRLWTAWRTAVRNT